MTKLSLAVRLPATASALALAASFIAAPSAALAQTGTVTSGEVNECATLPTEQDRQLCLQGKAGNEASPEEQGELGTLPPDEVAEQRTEGGTIVVTGSRIRRSEFTTPDPIQIINPELGARQGQIETVELINTAPIASGSTQITSVISTNFVTNGGEGAQTVSLRGLGAERTLILVNGRRAGPAGVRGAVASFDLNTIPSSIVGSVEILKTGASSIYGSDAIAGVVNILTKRDTNGIELRGFASPTEHGGADRYNVSATYGRDFGRGHILVSGDYFRQGDLERRQRSFLDCQEEFLTFVDGRRADLVDVRTGRPACSGTLNNAVLTNNDFTGPGFSQGLLAPNGQQLFVSQFSVGNELIQAGCVPINGLRPGVVAPANFFGCNFDGPSTGVLNNYSQEERNTDVFSALERRTLFADASFELTPGIELFTELLYNNRKTDTDGLAQVSSFQFTGQSVLPQFFCAPTDFNCLPTDPGDPFNPEFRGNFLLRPLVSYAADSGTDVDYYRGVLGARGDFGGFARGFSWDVHGQYSRSDGDYYQDIAFNDAVFTQDFRTRSCVGLFTPVTNTPCIDIDFMDPRVLRGEFTPEERAFLFGRVVGNTLFKQMSGEATVSGELFNLPAGPLGIAAGAHIRQDKINDVPGEAERESNLFNRTSAGITAGKTLTKEVFGEVELPLLRDLPLVQRLTLSAAGRITQVDAERRDGEEDDFGDKTWKLGADWKVTDFLRVRGSMGTSFRAPALFELFLENQTGFQTIQNVDPCLNLAARLALGQISQLRFDNCTAAGIPPNFTGSTGGVTVISGGGLGNLEPETSKAKVIGAILTPTFSFLPDTQISLAVDYFDIEVSDEISQLGASNILLGCYNSENFATEPLCNLITRATSGPEINNLTEIEDTYINVNRQKNRGVDLTGRINHDFGRFGRVSLLGQMTWQLEDTIELFEGTVVNANTEIGDPEYTADFNFSWQTGPWTMVYGLDIIGSADDRDDLRAQQGAALDAAGCRTSVNRTGFPPAESAAGQRVRFCPDVSVPAIDYHALSLTREIGERYAITLGVANLFDKEPPRISTVSGFNGNTSTFAQVPAFASQYDYLGRRFFVNVRANIGGTR